MIRAIGYTLILSLITVRIVYGQGDFRKGYVITLEKDTIQGNIAYRNNAKNYESCVFKNEIVDTEYLPDQILGFRYVDDKLFSSQIIPGSFVEVLVEGEMSLYKSKYQYHIKKDTTLFELESIIERIEFEGKIMNKEMSKWRGIVSYLISDCLGNSQNLTANLRLDEESLTKLVLKYNKCKNSEYTDFKEGKSWTNVDFGALAGLASSKLVVKSASALPYLDESYSTITPSIGLVMAISSPRFSEKITFQGELHFSKSSFSSSVILNSPFPRFNETFIELTTISVPLSLKYSLAENGNKKRVYFQGGISYDFHLKAETRLLSRQGGGSNETQSAFDTYNAQAGIWGGIGTQQSFSKCTTNLTLRYTEMYKLNSATFFKAQINRISLNLILMKN